MLQADPTRKSDYQQGALRYELDILPAALCILDFHGHLACLKDH